MVARVVPNIATDNVAIGQEFYTEVLRRYAFISSRIRAASVSTANGLVSTCIPGSRWPLPMTAFSA